MDDVWCSLDMAADIPGLQSALADPLWSPFADCGASSVGNTSACFGVADLADLMASTHEVKGMADMDATGCFFGGGNGSTLGLQHELMRPSASSSLSSNRSLSIDSGGSSGSYYTFDAAVAAAEAATKGHASQHLPAATPVAHHPFTDHDDEAIMRAMMAVMSSSSASPSPSASASSPPFSRDGTQEATVPAELRGGDCHVMVKSSSSLAMSPEKIMCGQEEQRSTASGNGAVQQLYHMLSERKRREKLNDSFLTLRSLLPPCSKKDKTTVLSNAASYLRTLEAQVSELEKKNGKLEKHIPSGDGGGNSTHQRRQQRAKVQISKAAPSTADESSSSVVNLTVMVMVECDVVELVLRILECLRWMEQVSLLSVDADTYSPQVLLKAIASIKLRITDDDGWNEASFHEAMTKAVHDATSAPPAATA